MMQIGNNVNNLMFLSAFKQSKYYESTLPRYDRRILGILNNYSGADNDVCFGVKELNDTLYEDGELFLSGKTNTLD